VLSRRLHNNCLGRPGRQLCFRDLEEQKFSYAAGKGAESIGATFAMALLY
jgi:hypothetical protein